MSDAPGRVPVRDAATVVLVRDGGAGLEVFMLRRNLRSDFVGGAYVFPGGAVDDDDRADDLEAVCAGRSDAEASSQLGVPAGGLAFWVAAVRECFEEAGVLLARHDDGASVRLDDPLVAERFSGHRRAVDGGARRLVDVCADEHLRLDVAGMHYFSHWITPEGPVRRYDTRFFVARAPEHQVPLHDDREVIANEWLRPSDALARHREGTFEMIFPTIKTLQAIERFTTADELLAAAAAIEQVPAVLPRIVEAEGGVRILLPGDPGYDDAVSAELSRSVPLSAIARASAAAPPTNATDLEVG